MRLCTKYQLQITLASTFWHPSSHHSRRSYTTLWFQNLKLADLGFTSGFQIREQNQGSVSWNPHPEIHTPETVSRDPNPGSVLWEPHPRIRIRGSASRIIIRNLNQGLDQESESMIRIPNPHPMI
jgi:hypothetical protein